MTVAELEEIAARGWPSPDTAWIGRWWLRAADGFTGRANSVLPLGPPGLPLDAALSVASRWYEERDLPARFLLEIDSPSMWSSPSVAGSNRSGGTVRCSSRPRRWHPRSSPFLR